MEGFRKGKSRCKDVEVTAYYIAFLIGGAREKGKVEK